jgi:sugar phosphate isomerase/epimerase
LFTGQWADLPLAELAPRAKEMGFDGLELACWGDHLDVKRGATDKEYCNAQKKLLEDNGLQLFAISNHLAGQAVSDVIDERHKAILPPHVWGDGDPKGVNQRAADEMKDTARTAANLGVKVVNGFTGSSIWPYLYSFPAGAAGLDRQGL